MTNKTKANCKKKFNEKLYNRCYKILNGLAQCIPPKIPRNTPPPTPRQVPIKYLREILYLTLKENTFQFCSSNYLQTHGTAMGTKMAIAFANILIEKQILRHSCIEPYTGTHQRIFLACGGMLRCRLQANRSLAEGRSHWRQSCKKKSFPCGSL